MANRILLDDDGLKISQAGVNVLSATPAQLLFSSDWSAIGLVQSGTYTINSWSGTTHFREHSGSIALSKTFPSPPFCAFFSVLGSALIPVGFGSGALFGGVRGSGAAGGEDAALVHAQVSNTSIAIRAMFNKEFTPSLAVPTFRIRYFVFDYNT